MMAALAAGSMALSSCDDDKIYDMNHQEANIIGSITLDWEDEITLPLGTNLQLNPVILPEEAASTGIMYKTSNADIAFVDDLGELHCVGLGTAYITVVPSIGFGASADLAVNVVESVVYAQSVTIEGVEELAQYHYYGDEFQLKAIIGPEDHTYNYVTWSSSNPEIISVDNEGNVVCNALGSATITATTKFPDKEGVSGSLTLAVSESVDVDYVEIAAVTEEQCIDMPFDLDVTYYPDYGNKATVEWTSSDENIAYVNRGHVIPTGYGTAVLTATSTSGKMASVTVTIASGWRIWDPTNRFNMWTAATAGSVFTYHDDYLEDKMAVSGTNYRADIKYACDANSPLTLDFSKYPVVALRTTIPDGGRNTFDVVDVDGVGGGNPQCNFGRFGTGNPIRLEDGTVLIYVDWSKRTQYSLTAPTSFKTFQLKVADMVVADTPVDSYKIYWIRTFKSVEEMQAFAEAQVAAGK